MPRRVARRSNQDEPADEGNNDDIENVEETGDYCSSNSNHHDKKSIDHDDAPLDSLTAGEEDDFLTPIAREILQGPDENTMRIMISTDNHLGYAEKDPVRGK
jgi:hypothetical protein